MSRVNSTPVLSPDISLKLSHRMGDISTEGSEDQYDKMVDSTIGSTRSSETQNLECCHKQLAGDTVTCSRNKTGAWSEKPLGRADTSHSLAKTGLLTYMRSICDIASYVAELQMYSL